MRIESTARLFHVLRAVPPEVRLGEEGAGAIRRLIADLERYMELARETPTGELLYQFLVDSGLMTRYAKAPAEQEQEVQNVSKFFARVRDASRVLQYDNVREFVNHLDALIDAGDDPAVAEADTDTPAVHVLTVHKAKGLEWPVVFLVNCVQEKFPTRRRGDALEMPLGLIKDTLPAGDFHLQEERRLFYVGMTRAKEALYLTSAEDMGGRKKWKTSQFVLEALDLPKDAARPFRASAVEELQHNAPPPAPEGAGIAIIPPGQELTVSHNQVDDYQTCPLKYQYIHVKRIPLRQHHSVVYGSALHKAVEFYLRRRAVGNFTSLEDFLLAFDDAWRNEGFLTREHEEQRKRAGVAALTRFYHEEEGSGQKPTDVEREFGFALGPTRVRGRFDRVDDTPEGAIVIDYKSSEVTEQKAADRRARESLQLKMYALAQKEMTGRLPARVELRFLESGLAGSHAPTEGDLVGGPRSHRDGRRRHPGATLRSHTRLPDLPLLCLQPDLSQHRHPRIRRATMKLKANGIEIHYDKQGSGPVVTLSHSLGCNLHMWDEQAKALASRYTVLRFDTRGHGQTSAPEGAYSLEQMSDDLKGLLDGLGITETHFVGLSMGGMIGQTFALRHPVDGQEPRSLRHDEPLSGRRRARLGGSHQDGRGQGHGAAWSPARSSAGSPRPSARAGRT